MKRIITLLLALLMLCSLAACVTKTTPVGESKVDADIRENAERHEDADAAEGENAAPDTGAASVHRASDVGNYINGNLFMMAEDGRVWWNTAVPRLMDPDGGNVTTVEMEHPVASARFVSDGWIYFWSASDEENRVDIINAQLGYLLRIRTDGTDPQRVLNLTETPVGSVSSSGMQIYVHEDWVYMGSVQGMFRVRTDGSEAEQLTDVATVRFDICDGWIYAIDCDEGQLFRMELDGSGREDLAEAVPPAQMSVLVEDGWAYFGSMQTGIQRVEIAGGSVEQVVDPGTARSFNLADGWIYCLAVDGEGAWYTYRMSVDGSKEEVLCSDLFALVPEQVPEEILQGVVYGPAIAEDWLLFSSPMGLMYTLAVRTDGSEAEARPWE